MTSSAGKHVRVTFEPEGRTVSVLVGTVLIKAAGRAGIVLDTPCGGKGTCGKCRVEITQGVAEPTASDRETLPEEALHRGFRLACQTRVMRDMRVTIPVAARFFDQQILTDGRGMKVALHPTVSKIHVRLPEPGLSDQRADADRLRDRIREKRIEPDLDVLRTLPSLLRQSDYDVTAVAAEGRLIAVEPGDTSRTNYGMAFDVGTTTVVGFLMDLATGREVAVAAQTNPQVAFGDDVVSRIRHTVEHPDGMKTLQRRIVACMNDIIGACCRKARVRRRDIYEVTVVGNTTMNHLLLGICPEYVAVSPYVAALRRSVTAPARDLRLRIHRSGLIHTLPNIAGFVGADTVGVILATRMYDSGEMNLAIDIGTNGEIVVGNRDRLVSCSTAAGPAFEGARIRFGMRAAEGAIDKLLIDSDVEYNVIGDVAPRGFCGTALIDLVAELLRVGALAPNGRLLPPDAMPASVPDAIRRRVVAGENEAFDFVVAPAEESGIDGSILLTQRDIRELQLAKGAIAAGVAIMLKELKVTPNDLGHVLLAGAFGNFIRRKMAKGIGLLPDIPSERILYVGNAAGAGARMALQSRRCKRTADRISEQTEYLELAGRPDFQMEFMSAMLFPGGE